MSSGDIAISVRNLSKSYTIAHNAAKHTTMAEAMMHRIRHPMDRAQQETFWALRELSFDIKQGSVVGVVGRNGAGKSTLLKILSRITEPTVGRVDLYGTMGSLLEVGTGFHPELTGRENIYLNGQILGMRKREVDARFDEIVDFAGVEKFLDTPVKRYSSGMYVRLAFAIAAHLRAEILVVDEVLSVGDAEFQQKCMGKMRDVATSGRTVLFVSHNANAVASLCNMGILLHKGTLQAMGPTAEILDQYCSMVDAEASVDLTQHPSRVAKGLPIFQSLTFLDGFGRPASAFDPGAELKISMTLDVAHKIPAAKVGVAFQTSRGERVFAVATYLGNTILPPLQGPVTVTCDFRLPHLIPGRYTIDIAINDESGALDTVTSAAAFDVREVNYLEMTTPYFPEMGQIMVKSQWNVADVAPPGTGSEPRPLAQPAGV